MAECIYCRKMTEASEFSRPDHVMPKAFGRFKNNFTIFCVCEECNQWFGDNLEVSFGRNSGEAILRLMFGIKPPDDAHEVGGRRVELTLDDESELKGAKVYFTASEDGRLVTRAPLQVGFCILGGRETKWFLESELTKEAVMPLAGCATYTIGGDANDYARVEQRLRDLGLSRDETRWITTDEADILRRTVVRIDYQIDVEALRTVGKIGFNYLALQAGCDFALLADFDPYRRFVRFGEGEPDHFIRVSTEPLLLDKQRYGGQLTTGHLVTAEWHPRKHGPSGDVSLFNNLRYHLSFARHMSVIWRHIRSGHHFDLSDLTIDEMVAVWWRPIM